MKVLICDDDYEQLQLLNRYVQKQGHTTVICSRGMDAWSYLKAGEFDVVITDWRMPILDGLELCRRIRRQSKDTYTYVVLLTAMDAMSDLKDAMLAGADDYIRKPLEREELEARLIAAQRICSVYETLFSRQKELAKLNEVIRKQARTDPLTKLFNRMQLKEDLASIACRSDRYDILHAFLLLDIDEFKRYNDHYGHLSGDDLLVRVSDSLRSQMRSGDSVYRYGGEEFLVVLYGQDEGGMVLAAQRIRRAIEAMNIPHEKSILRKLTISIGASLHERGKHPLETLRAADRALYSAKSAGRNCVRVWSRTSTNSGVILPAGSFESPEMPETPAETH